MEEKRWTLEINRNNVLNWLSFIRDVYPLSDEDKKKLNKFIKTRYTVKRDKLLDDIYGGLDG